MASDNKLNGFAQRLDQRIAEHRDRQAQARTELEALYRRADAEQQARAQAHRALATHPHLLRYGATMPQLQLRVELHDASILQQLDQLMWMAFGLDALFPDNPLGRYPVVYCETLEEFFTPIVADLDVSETERAKILEREVAEAEEIARERGGGVLGVNIPGRGCYVNGWLFGYLGRMPARDALEDPSSFRRILETVCHEKLGHGFLAELTATGREKTRLGLWRFDLARRFSLRRVDSPQSALLRQKSALLHQATRFTEEGWATWIEGHMLWRAAREGLLPDERIPTPLIPKYTLEQMGRVLRMAHNQEPGLRPLVDRMEDAVQILLLTSDRASDQAILEAVRVWQVEASRLDPIFTRELGQPISYVLGYLLMRRLEAQLGWQNLPYALLIAANVTYQLDQIPVGDLLAVLASDPRLNVDARLALLCTLRLAPGQGPGELAGRAREELSLAVPEELTKAQASSS